MNSDRHPISKTVDSLATFLSDLRYGARSLLRGPLFTVVVVMTLALGIGANTAIFTLVNAVLIRSLPVESPEELYVLGNDQRRGMMTSDQPFERDSSLFSYPLFLDFRESTEAFEDLAAFSSYSIDAYASAEGPAPGESLERVHVQLVSGNFFSLLGVPAAVGRTLLPIDNQNPGAHPVAVISHGLWTRRFARGSGVIDREIELSGTRYTIVGVAPQTFRGVTLGHSIDVWVPLMMQAEIMREASHLDDRETMWLRIIGRLDPAMTAANGALRTNDLFRRLVAGTASSQVSEESRQRIVGLATELVPFSRGFSPLRIRYAEPLVFLMVIVGLVLLIACANVGNLQLARAASREQEVAVRMALGSSRSRLLRHLLTESLILALLGGALGLLVARWTISLLLGLISTRAVPIDVGIDLRVLGFTVLLSIASVLLFGLMPAWRATRTELSAALKREAGVSDSPGLGWGLREALLVSQVAISLPLLVAAGLLLASLQNLRAEETGMSPDEVLLAFIDPQGAGYETDRLSSLYQRLLGSIEALPDVESASLAMYGTFGGGRRVLAASIDGSSPQSDAETRIENDLVTPEYFATIGAQILAGRNLVESDREGAAPVAIVNQAFARRFYGGDSPLGRRFGVEGDESSRQIEIVGVVRDFKKGSLRGETEPAAYFPLAQEINPVNTIFVRTREQPVASSAQLRLAISEIAPDLPILAVRPLSEEIERTLQQDKMISKLAVVFGALALVLASLGLYGVVAYGVARRTREIGVRIALGALRRQVVWMALKNALMLVVMGIAIGLAAALALGRLMSSLLFGLDPANLETLFIAALMLIGVTLAAGYWPARRASHLDPIQALRQE